MAKCEMIPRDFSMRMYDAGATHLGASTCLCIENAAWSSSSILASCRLGPYLSIYLSILASCHLVILASSIYLAA